MDRARKLIYTIFLIVFWAGCVSHANDLVRQGKMFVEILEPEVMVKILNVQVLKKDSTLEVSGQVKRTGLGIMNGHIDIVVFSPEGKVLGKSSTPYFPDFHRTSIRRRGLSPASFFANIPDGFPMGAIVRIAFHSQKLNKSLDCGNNQALANLLQV